MARKLNELNIWLNGESVGIWRRKAGQEELKYDEDWVKSERGRPLSLSLPFTPGNQLHRGDSVKFYFDNLLPDSRDIRERFAIKFNAKSSSPFDLLVELGRDCVGAIQLLRPEEAPEKIDSIKCKPLDETEVADILRKTVSIDPFGHRDDENLRISLAGAQEKTALLWYEDQWCLPQGTTPTTHILKLPIGLVGNMQANMNDSVENEWLCSKIVEAFGLPIANCEIAQFEDQKTLVVERFDRRKSSDGTWIVRLPQEDLCQAKGISPLHKYQRDGGPGILDCVKILNGSVESRIDKQIFFKAQIIFWLLYATDGHGKNFSIRHQSRDTYQLTPLYDVLSIFPILGKRNDQISVQKASLAMAIRGNKNHYLINQIQRRHFINQANQVGFSKAEAEEMITDIVEKSEKVVNSVSDLLPQDFPRKLARKIFDGLIRQTNKLAI